MDEQTIKKKQFIRKSAFGRTNLFLTSNSNVIFKEVKCSAYSIARQACHRVYHTHKTTTDTVKCNLCWHCCHTYENDAFRIPRLYDPAEKIYHVYGWFCSPNCGKAYLLEHSTFDRGYQMNIFVRMYRQIYNITDTIIEAPPRLTLKEFGGPFDITEFRQNNNICAIINPPFVSYCMLVEEKK